MIVIIESPYGANPPLFTEYARKCLKDSLMRGESPFASHLLYTQVLDDSKPTERELGISAGLEVARAAELTAVYMDHGVSPGMQRGIDHAVKFGRRVTYRRLYAPVRFDGQGLL